MERLCFVMELNPGQEEKYDRVHREMFPEMHDALVGAGYQNYTIFRLRTTVVGYAECVPDVATVLDRMANDPVSRRWAGWPGTSSSWPSRSGGCDGDPLDLPRRLCRPRPGREHPLLHRGAGAAASPPADPGQRLHPFAGRLSRCQPEG